MFELNDHEKDIVFAYRSATPDFRAAVDKLLKVAPAPEKDCSAAEIVSAAFSKPLRAKVETVLPIGDRVYVNTIYL